MKYEKELIETVEVSGYTLRVNKNSFDSGYIDYTFGIDNPRDDHDIQTPKLDSEGGGVGLVYISAPYMRDLSTNDVDKYIQCLNNAKVACGIFNERIEKYLQLQKEIIEN